jgi:predicted short-subunit dehydrogenase-like oxidoreductase (DUF2520 family)
VALGGRNKIRVAAAAQRIGTYVRICNISEAARLAQVVLLCVTDDAIEDVCAKLAKQKKFAPGAIVVHCSGVFSSDILSTARDYCKCSVASMHPLQTFPTINTAIEKMKGAYCFCEGDKNAIPVIAELAEDIGLKPVRISDTSKILYHAAAVVACNYFVALIDSAIAIAANAGIDNKTAWLSLKPLVTATLNNIDKMGTTGSLTGPIARGDVQTISRHLHEMARNDEALVSIYRTLGLYTAELAVKKGSITTEKAKKIKSILQAS